MDDKKSKLELKETSFAPYLGYLGAMLSLFITVAGIVCGVVALVMLQKEEPSIEKTHSIFFNILLIVCSSALFIISLILNLI